MHNKCLGILAEIRLTNHKAIILKLNIFKWGAKSMHQINQLHVVMVLYMYDFELSDYGHFHVVWYVEKSKSIYMFGRKCVCSCSYWIDCNEKMLLIHKYSLKFYLKT